MLALIGFAMIGVIIFLLLQEKLHPALVFVIVPVIAAVLAGAGMADLAKFVKFGVEKTMSVAVLFIFSITYFCVMNDAGMFDKMVDVLTRKAGNNVVLVTVATTVIAIIGHLDGALASTILVTCPAMLPVYRRLNMRPVVMLACLGAAMAIMNLVPWGGPTARVAAVTGLDVRDLWVAMLPVQAFGLALALGFATYLGIVEKRRGAGYRADGGMCVGGDCEAPDPALKRPKLVLFNVALTLGVIGLLCFSKLPAYFDFMLGLAIALMVNYPNLKDQTARIKAHAAEALSVPAVLLTTGIFLGVLTGTKMIDAMAVALISVIPDALGPVLHLIMGAVAVPVGMMLGTDSYFFGLMPLAIKVGQQFGVSQLDMAYAMLIGKNYGVLVTPHAATTYLAIGMAGGISLKEHFAFCIPRLWLLGILSLVAAVVMGVVHI